MTGVTFDLEQLDRFVKRLDELGKTQPVVEGIIGGLADLWVDTGRAHVGWDSGQTYRRTRIDTLSATRSRGEARVESDTPYAGYHNYGTRFQPPNRYWDLGQDAAEAAARRLEGEVRTEARRVLESGGEWKPARRWVDPR